MSTIIAIIIALALIAGPDGFKLVRNWIGKQRLTDEDSNRIEILYGLRFDERFDYHQAQEAVNTCIEYLTGTAKPSKHSQPVEKTVEE